MKMYAIIIPKEAIPSINNTVSIKVELYMNFASSDKQTVEEKLDQARKTWKMINFKMVEFEL